MDITMILTIIGAFAVSYWFVEFIDWLDKYKPKD